MDADLAEESAAEPALPDSTRRQLLLLAAETLGALEEDDVPVGLRRVRSFAPARRARTGATSIAAALTGNVVFRQQVAQAWSQVHADLATLLEGGAVPAAAEPSDVLVGAYLLRPPGWASVVADASERMARSEDLEREETGRREVDTVLDDLRRQLNAERETVVRLGVELAAMAEELATARRSDRRLRADADRAKASARVVEQDAAALTAAAQAERAAALKEVRRATEQLSATQQSLEQARRVVREGRTLADSRTRLLLDTIVEAATGLRRELALPPVDLRPADVVAADVMALDNEAARTPGTSPDAAAGTSVPARGLPADDPATLDALLALPRVHLVVDGYNVTKSGFAAMPLVDQRRRLVDGLVALAARTGAEVTCCFDGAELEGRIPSGSARGVRVLFSAAGDTADELIRRLVRAEPRGRPLVVVSSDLEVVAGVHASGARAVPASALLRRLGRG